MLSEQQRAETSEVAGSKYVIVTCDTHCGPSLKHQLRDYCDSAYLRQFDDFVRSVEERLALDGTAGRADAVVADRPNAAVADRANAPEGLQRAFERTINCEGQGDMQARLRDLGSEGIAAEVIFGGGLNGEQLPFASPRLGEPTDLHLTAVGFHIYNRWLADFVSLEPERHVGLAHVPIWDVEAAVEEVEWAREAGLRGVNFPAPRSSWPAYNDPVYEPFWSACESLGLPLCCHSGGGDLPLGMAGPGGSSIYMSEALWFSRRALWELIFGGVFERHPGLKLTFAEQRGGWVPQTLRDLDSIYLTQHQSTIRTEVLRRPSEYWSANCYLVGSFAASFEVDLRYEIGVDNFMWGSDYPHPEGTWPRTGLALRKAFAGVPEPETRAILGENAIRIFDLDGQKLRAIADQIGPSPEEVNKPLDPAEIPDYRGFAFREVGQYA